MLSSKKVIFASSKTKNEPFDFKYETKSKSDVFLGLTSFPLSFNSVPISYWLPRIKILSLSNFTKFPKLTLSTTLLSKLTLEFVIFGNISQQDTKKNNNNNNKKIIFLNSPTKIKNETDKNNNTTQTILKLSTNKIVKIQLKKIASQE